MEVLGLVKHSFCSHGDSVAGFPSSPLRCPQPWPGLLVGSAPCAVSLGHGARPLTNAAGHGWPVAVEGFCSGVLSRDVITAHSVVFVIRN